MVEHHLAKVGVAGSSPVFRSIIIKPNNSFTKTISEPIRLHGIFHGEFDPGSGRTLAACLIHASRANRKGACSFDVSGGRVSNTWATYPIVWDNSGKPGLIPNNLFYFMVKD